MSEELLTQQQQAAAQLLASGTMEKQEIAKQLSISRTTLYNWMMKENFKAEVDRLKHELKSFGEEFIAGKLVEAINNYWSLIKTSENDRVVAEGYRYFIDRSLGKPTTKVDLEAGLKENKGVPVDVLEDEFEEEE